VRSRPKVPELGRRATQRLLRAVCDSSQEVLQEVPRIGHGQNLTVQLPRCNRAFRGRCGALPCRLRLPCPQRRDVSIWCQRAPAPVHRWRGRWQQKAPGPPGPSATRLDIPRQPGRGSAPFVAPARVPGGQLRAERRDDCLDEGSGRPGICSGGHGLAQELPPGASAVGITRSGMRIQELPETKGEVAPDAPAQRRAASIMRSQRAVQQIARRLPPTLGGRVATV
jgi:hypothetical protein